MKISRVENSSNKSVSFSRKPNALEMVRYTSSVNRGLELLNKRLDIIIHNSSAPSIPKENTGIGSLFSKTVQEKLMPFLKQHGFTCIQQEPNNLRKPSDPSPYASESFAKNIYMIPLEKLTTDKYGKILPKAYFNHIVLNKPNADVVDYAYINKEYNRALKIAYNNFKDNKVLLKTEFEQFKKDNYENLEKAAIYRILDNIYKKGWNEWPGIDRNLYTPIDKAESVLADARIKTLRKKYADEIDFFMFQQFLVELENKDSNKLSKETGIKIIGDSPVALSAAEEWINQNLLLKDKALGCPPDDFSAEGQKWGFSYFNPKYIFNPDGTLGKAGKILKEKYDRFFASFPGGLRIDHIIGLVDPFIYSTKAEMMTPVNSGRIYSMNGEFKKKPEEYSNILEKIVLQSAKEHGMDKKDIICEDLGEPNKPTQMVMKKLDLSGVAVTQFDYRGADTPAKNVIMIGSHDNSSFIEYINKIFEGIEGKDTSEKPYIKTLIDELKILLHIKKRDEVLEHFMTKTKLLAKDTAPKNASKNYIKNYKQEIRTDKNKFMEAGFAELFTSPAKRVQFFFTDFFGIGKTYNLPGTDKGNWILRIGSNFENDYYDAVADGKAPNLAKAIATALRQRGLDKQHPDLMRDLNNSARILSEKKSDTSKLTEAKN